MCRIIMGFKTKTRQWILSWVQTKRYDTNTFCSIEKKTDLVYAVPLFGFIPSIFHGINKLLTVVILIHLKIVMAYDFFCFFLQMYRFCCIRVTNIRFQLKQQITTMNKHISSLSVYCLWFIASHTLSLSN